MFVDVYLWVGENETYVRVLSVSPSLESCIQEAECGLSVKMGSTGEFIVWIWNSLLNVFLFLFDRLCGLVVRVSGYRYRGLGFDSRRYQIF